MNIGRILTKIGSGFAGGFATGGFYGGLTGGTTAAFTGGKNKPLKSLAIGAGSGFVGGIAAQKLGLQGSTTRVGPYSFRPLSSRALSFIRQGGPIFPKTETANTTPSTPSTPSGIDTPNQGASRPVFAFLNPFKDSGVPAERKGKSSNWLPIAAAAGAILFMKGA